MISSTDKSPYPCRVWDPLQSHTLRDYSEMVSKRLAKPARETAIGAETYSKGLQNTFLSCSLHTSLCIFPLAFPLHPFQDSTAQQHTTAERC